MDRSNCEVCDMSEPHRTFIPAAGYDWLLPLYDPFQKLFLGGWAYRQLVDEADLQRAQRVLEIGCGTGSVTVLIKRLHPQTEVVGLDPDPKALDRARHKGERAAVAVHLDRGFADGLPYHDRSFDRVFSSFMFHHLTADEKAKTLLETRRVLKPDGSLHLLDFGGMRERPNGFLARLIHHHEQLQGNAGDRIPMLMRAAGFSTAAEVAHRMTIFGRVAFYRAAV
jgi:ubiquinone/menaquinone biosynthesis C-methylase UbiE